MKRPEFHVIFLCQILYGASLQGTRLKVMTTVVYKRIYFETFISMLEFVMSCPEAINICNNKTLFFLLKLEANLEEG